jgi:nitrate/nitrite-specific signal transduction histidine kinase
MNVMPKGIKKRTAATVRAEMEKQATAINDMRAAIRKAKEDYENKVRQMCADLNARKKQLGALQKEYRQLMQDEQRETLSAMMFNGDLSPSDINAALNALGILFSGQGNKTAAIQRLQDIAKEQDNSVISNLVSEIGNENG